jgi:hypothetical protein
LPDSNQELIALLHTEFNSLKLLLLLSGGLAINLQPITQGYQLGLKTGLLGQLDQLLLHPIQLPLHLLVNPHHWVLNVLIIPRGDGLDLRGEQPNLFLELALSQLVALEQLVDCVFEGVDLLLIVGLLVLEERLYLLETQNQRFLLCFQLLYAGF